MHSIDPNDMDALFKEGADKHEFAYNDAAWALMEEKLNKKSRDKRLVWLLICIVIVAITSLLFVKVFFNDNADTATNLNSIKDEVIIHNAKGNKTDLEKQQLGIVTASQKVILKGKSLDVKGSLNSLYPVRSSNLGRRYNYEVEQIADSNNQIKNVEKIIEISANEQLNNYVDKRLAYPNNQIERLGISKIKYINNLSLEPIFTFDSNLQKENKKHVSFKVFGGTEWSSVSILPSPKLGYKFGGSFGLLFSTKWQLDLGVALSQKKYTGAGDAFTMEDGWYDGIMPMKMDAKCNIIEIPIDLSYYFNGFNRNSFYINVGLSSYLLNSEWYGFEYNEAMIEPSTIDLLVKELNPEEIESHTHLAGVGKISIGYQKYFSQNKAIEISPYLQIPLTGIGEGKVNLYSAGVQLALKFQSK